MHRSAACQELIADSVMAEAEFEEPNLFTLHTLAIARERAEIGAETDSGPFSSPIPVNNERPGLILVHDADDATKETLSEKVPNTAAILREGWPWVDETAEAVDILLKGVDFSGICASASVSASVVAQCEDEHVKPEPKDSLFSHDDHSATQDIIQCHPAAEGNTMNDTRTDKQGIEPALPAPVSENAAKPSTMAHGEDDHDLGKMVRFGEEPTLGEPVISDADMATMREAMGDRQSAKMRPLPTLPSPGSIAKIGEQKTGTAPKRIGSGRLVPARLTWKPGDPFAGTVNRLAKRRFRWEIMLTSASITAASGMGCAWLLRAIFA